MNTRSLTVLLLAALLLPALAACSDSPEVGTTSVLCEGGDLINADLATLCVVEGPITETRFTCPRELPHRYEIAPDLLVCTSDELNPSDLEDELRDRGYLPPPDLNNNPGNNFNNQNNINNNTNNNENNPNNNQNNVNNNPPPPLCTPGEAGVCACPDGSHGAAICEDDPANGPQWGACTCQDGWTAPGVNAVQTPPLDCQQPPDMLGLTVDLENDQPLGGPCLEEVFAQGCPLLQTRFTYDGDLTTRERLELINDAAYPRLSVASQRLYMFYGEYERTWSYGADGLLDLETLDNDLDGTIDTTTTTTWDAPERPATQDTTGPGYTASTRWTYDDAGRVIHSLTRYTSDGVDNTFETTRTYREDGTLLDEATTQNGERYTWVMRTFDDTGLLLRESTRNYDSIGTETTFAYREDRSLESSRTVETRTAVEENGREFRYTSAIIERRFDERGNELEAITDHSGNGTSFTAIRATYDAWDRPLTQSYGPRDGDPEHTWTYTYAPDGGPLEQVVRREVRFRRDHLTTTTYNAFGSPLTEEKREEGTDLLLSRTVNTYNDAGQQLLYENDYNGDGVIEHRITWTRDRAGNLYDVQDDVGADGFIEERVTYRYACE